MSDLTLASGRAARKEQGGAHPNILIFLVFLAGTLALASPAINGGIFNALSTDDAMRLVEVRDLIGGQGWFDPFQYRLDPPGTSMHWSRLIDAPLAALILLLKPILGMHGAEAATLYFWPALLFSIALALTAAIARQMSNNVDPVIAAVVLAALSIPSLVHFRAGAIDHHSAQIDLLLALVLMTAQIEQSAVKGALGGAIASLSLAIGIEMLPAIAALGLAVFGLFVWRGAAVARQVGAFGAGLAASSLLLAPALLPLSSLTRQVCDAFGAPLLLLTVGGGLSLTLMAAIDRYYHSTLGMRAVSGTALAIVLAGALLSLFSGCIASPYSHLDPLVVSLWVNNVAESISFARMLQLFPEKVPATYGFPIMTTGLALMALIRSPAPERFRWIVGIAALAALIGFSFWEMRGTAGATLLAAPVFAASLTILWPSFASGRNLLLASIVASPLCLLTAGLWTKPMLDSAFKGTEIAVPSPCRSLSDVASLKRLPKGRVMAPIDLGPAILAQTAHDVFAAPYHRDNDGNAALIKLMLAPLPTARQILSDHRVDYLITCSAAPDRNIIELAPEGLEARLSRGETPDFLERLDLDPAHKISVWRVRN